MARLALLVAVLLAAAAAVSSCGAEDVAPPADPAQAADNTLGGRSAQATFKATIESDAFPDSVEMTGEGEVDFERNLTGLEIEGGVPDSDQRFRMDQVVDGDELILYMRSPQFARALPGGKEWLKVDVAKASERAGLDITALPEGSTADPVASLRYLRAVSDFEKVGEDEIDGAPTTHYKATVDVRRYPDLAPKGRRADAERSVDKLVEMMGGKSTMPMEVWVDEDGRVRRQTVELVLEIPGTGASMTLTTDFGMADFGSDVDVDVPDEEETVDAADLPGFPG